MVRTVNICAAKPPNPTLAMFRKNAEIANIPDNWPEDELYLLKNNSKKA